MTRTVQVVVTCYNHAPYIQQCLESIFQQTYKNLRLAVYNDGSTDDSALIIEEVLSSSPFEQTAYHNQFNQGLVKTRNLALDTYLGQADYLLFVDSDNFLEADYIEQLLLVAEEEGADIVYADLVNPDDGQRVVRAIPFDLAAFYEDNMIDSCSLIRQSSVGSIRYDETLNYKKLEDYEFFFQLLVRRGGKAVNCTETFLNYRVLSDSMSARHDVKKYYDAYFYILGKHFASYPDLAQKALQSNYERLYRALSLEEQYNRQFLAVYYSCDLTFHEVDKLEFPLTKTGQLAISVPIEASYLRLDLSELPSYYEEVKLVDNHYKTQVFPIFSNGHQLLDGYAFNHPDPQLIFDLRGTASRDFLLTYRLANISDLMAEDYLLKLLTQQLEEEQLKTKELTQQLRHHNKHLVMLRAQRDKLRRDQEDLVVRYNSVTHSRRWTIPSKIIAFFRRKS